VKVAIIGTGNMGTGLGRQFAAGAHEVIVGSRDAQRARAKAAEIGASGAGTYAEAIAQADAFLLAVNWWDIEDVFPQLGGTDGKILIDCTLPGIRRLCLISKRIVPICRHFERRERRDSNPRRPA